MTAQVEQDLYQFSTYAPQIDLSFHQYLLIGDEPVLFHTGDVRGAAALIPQLNATLNGKTLKYIFVSHFEADECGGLSLISGSFPEAVTVCSEVTARQLVGFGYKNKILTKKPGEKLISNSYELEFFSYPSEMHLWEGLLALENRRGIFFSSDIMIRRGQANGIIIDTAWNTEINNIRPEQVPDPERLAQLQKTLTQLSPKLVATGHGPCLRLN
ncbi:MAG: MBL fold metallo-hydrolase [Anaerolineaceae bacterium]|nr:MBL fold metallo-hydrolase [Anaerolineaceae bacterium]